MVSKQFAVAVLFASSALWSTESLAYHTDEDRQTDFSAYTLQQGQLRLGLFQQEVGIFDWWTVGTYTAPWILNPIARSFNGSLYTKLKFVDTGKFALAFRPTAFYLSFHDLSMGDLEDGEFEALVLPLILTGSYVINDDWSASAEATWVQTVAGGDAEAVEDSSALGAIAQSNLQFALYGEYRISRVVAVNMIGRYVPFTLPVNISGSSEVDETTSLTFDADAEDSGVKNAWLLQAGMAFSWKTFNFHFGVGYGNFILPGARIVGAQKIIVPDFDIFWRF